MHRPTPIDRPVPIVHAVTNDEIVRRPGFMDRARDVMRALGERGALQLRAPRFAASDAASFLSMARSLAAVQAETSAWLVINDRVDVALIVGARGIQLSGTSLEPTDASRVIVQVRDRRVHNTTLGEAPGVGASVHSLEEGIAARLGGANWAVVSHVLARRNGAAHEAPASEGPRHAHESGNAGVTLLQQLVRHSGLPIVAIGGIVPQHVTPLRKLGVHGVAAIRGIWDAENASHSATDYLSAYDSEVGR